MFVDFQNQISTSVNQKLTKCSFRPVQRCYVFLSRVSVNFTDTLRKFTDPFSLSVIFFMDSFSLSVKKNFLSRIPFRFHGYFFRVPEFSRILFRSHGYFFMVPFLNIHGYFFALTDTFLWFPFWIFTDTFPLSRIVILEIPYDFY